MTFDASELQVTYHSKTFSRFLLIGSILLAGCSRKATPTESSYSPAPATVTRGKIAGVRYLEFMTGGAQPEERVPMIVGLHAMAGDPEGLLETLRRYPQRARLVLPYGHPGGGTYVWYLSAPDEVSATDVTKEADRIVDVVTALVAARPTTGKPILTGFSQGGIMTFVIAVTHPDAIAAAFPIGGLLPMSMYPSAPRAGLPPVTAFHGGLDRAVPTERARESIMLLHQAGFDASIHEYAGVAHVISTDEEHDLFEAMARVR